MIEFRIAELKVGDEFTVNECETWYRVSAIKQAARREDRKIEAYIVDPPRGYAEVKYTMVRKNRSKVIVRESKTN